MSHADLRIHRLVHGTAGVMERQFDYHPMQHSDGDHAGQVGPHETMIMSADSREAGQIPWLENGYDGRLLEAPDLQQLPSFRMGNTSMTPYKRRNPRFFGILGYLLVLIVSICIRPASAVFVEFQNCLDESYKNNGQQLQLVPMFVSAVFNTTDPNHNLKVTVYTNVTGSTTGKIQYVLPPANDTNYWNSNDTTSGGKIISNPFPDTVAKITTLDNKVSVLSYTPYNSEEAFCDNLVNGTCPLGPTFSANA